MCRKASWQSKREGVPLHNDYGHTPTVQTIKNPPAMWEIWALSLGWEDPLEESMATYCSSLAWRIPRDRGAWGGYSPWGRKESDMTKQLSTAHTPQASAVGTILAKSWAHILGRLLWPIRCEKKEKDNWSIVNKDQEGLSFINDLNHLFTEFLMQYSSTALWICISTYRLICCALLH